MRSPAASRWWEVPPRYAACTLDAYLPANATQRRAREAIRDVIEGRAKNAVLEGPTGLGKTHLAAAAFNVQAAAEMAYEEQYRAYLAALAGAELVRARRSPRHPVWLNVPELLIGLRLDMGRAGGDRVWSERVELASDAELLILDDLGRERMSDWTSELLYALVNRRYERLALRTVVTTNLPIDELTQGFYWPAISRLAEDGPLVRLEGPDHRLPRPRGEPRETVRDLAEEQPLARPGVAAASLSARAET